MNLIRVAALLASITDDLATGAKLSPSQAAAIEASVAQNKAPLPDRLRLLGWYAAQPEPAHRDKRIALILALAQQGALGRLATHTAANISREASPEGYAKVKAVLLARAEKSKLPVDRSNAAWFVFPAEPDEAIRITAENGLMRDTAVLAAEPLGLCGEMLVIGREVIALALLDFSGVRFGVRLVEPFTVESFHGAQGRCGLARIQRCTRRIAVHIDHGARQGGADGGGADAMCEIVQHVYPDVGVLARQPG